MCSAKTFDKPCSREHFTRDINYRLKSYGLKKQKYLTSHSFRKTRITELWKSSKNEVVRG